MKKLRLYVFFLIVFPCFPGEKTYLDTDSYTGLFYPSFAWATWLNLKDGWLLFINAENMHETKGVCILEWKESLRLIAEADMARDGIMNAATSAVNDEGDIFFTPIGSPLLYQLIKGTTPKDARFARIKTIPMYNSLFFFNNSMIGGVKYPDQKVEAVFGDDIRIINALNNQLPQSVSHSAESRTNLIKMLLCNSKDKIALGYTTHSVVYVIDEQMKLKSIPVDFSFLAPLDKDYPKNFARHAEWINTFHRIVKLAWYNNALYAAYQKGYDGYGIWVRIPTKPDSKPYKWDNNKNSTMILAMGHEEIVLGTRKEEENGSIKWAIWRNSSLP